MLQLNDLWQAALGQLQNQMTQATFDTHVARTRALALDGDRLTVGTTARLSPEWLNGRLNSTITRTVSGVAGRQIEVVFVLANSETGPAAWPDGLEQATADLPEAIRGELLTPGERVAQADYLAAYFKRGGTGYGPVAHYTSFFWMQILGDAFLLWKYLDSLDKRPLEGIGPNYWSPVFEDFFFSDLAKSLNHRNPEYIMGEPRECNRSRVCRLDKGQPLAGPHECCWSTRYERIWHKPLSGDGQQIKCMRWAEGLLEKLRSHHLVRVEIDRPSARKPRLQIWRMLPLLTPYQHETHLVTDTIQAQHKGWIKRYGEKFGLDPRDPWTDWKQIAEPETVLLMPGYRLYETGDNYDQNQKRHDFVANAVTNPNYLPCMGDNQDSS